MRHVGFVVLHGRKFHHQSGVLVELFFCTQHEFMHDFAIVLNNKLNGFALLELQLIWGKRMLSVIVIVMVRLTALSSPAIPQDFCSFLTGPDFLACVSLLCAKTVEVLAAQSAEAMSNVRRVVIIYL